MGTVYFYDSDTNAVATANSSPDSLLYPDYVFYEAELHAGIGLHGPYNSMAALYAANPNAKNSGAAPIPGASATGTTPQGAAGAIANDTGITAVGDFFNQLKEGSLWLRIAEFAIGGILVAVALAHLTGVNNDVTKALKTGAVAMAA
jgi:hypothetical protein